MRDASRQPADGIQPLRVHQRFLQTAFLGLVSIRRDHMRQRSTPIHERIKTPGRTDVRAVAPHQETIPSQRPAWAGIAQPSTQPDNFRGIRVETSVRLPDQLNGRASGHQTEAVIDEEYLETLRPAGPAGDENSFALRAQSRCEQGGGHSRDRRRATSPARLIAR